MSDYNEHKIGDLLKAFLKQAQISPGYMNSRVESLWPEIMGPMIASMTTHIAVKNNKLSIQVNSAPLRQELQYSREQIIRTLNEALGEDYIKIVEIR